MVLKASSKNVLKKVIKNEENGTSTKLKMTLIKSFGGDYQSTCLL